MHVLQFNDLFFTPLSDNPTNFFTELQTRIGVMSLLDDDLKETFIEDALLRLESLGLDFQNALDDTYVNYDRYQTALLKKNVSDVENFKIFLQKLREE